MNYNEIDIQRVSNGFIVRSGFNNANSNTLSSPDDVKVASTPSEVAKIVKDWADLKKDD